MLLDVGFLDFFVEKVTCVRMKLFCISRTFIPHFYEKDVIKSDTKLKLIVQSLAYAYYMLVFALIQIKFN